MAPPGLPASVAMARLMVVLRFPLDAHNDADWAWLRPADIAR